MGQVDPIQNDGQTPTADRVIAHIRRRQELGIRTYGTSLSALNGRRAMQDLLEELLDAAHYTQQRLDEEDKLAADSVGDPALRDELDNIYVRRETVKNNPGRLSKEALARRYVEDVGFLRVTVEALLVAAGVAKTVPPPPPEGTEVARYQYRGACPDGADPIYDDESYDQECIDEWCRDPSSWSAGYYPEYRPLYGGQWYRVDPENPPEQPESSQWGSVPPEPAEDDGGAPEDRDRLRTRTDDPTDQT